MYLLSVLWVAGYVPPRLMPTIARVLGAHCIRYCHFSKSRLMAVSKSSRISMILQFGILVSLRLHQAIASASTAISERSARAWLQSPQVRARTTAVSTHRSFCECWLWLSPFGASLIMLPSILDHAYAYVLQVAICPVIEFVISGSVIRITLRYEYHHPLPCPGQQYPVRIL